MAEKTEDLNLPLSVVTRIVKDALPSGVLVSKEARLAISRAASVFVLHATTFANQHATSSKRKTLTGPDVLAALKELELDDLVPALTEALNQWKDAQAAKAAGKKAAKAAANTSAEAPEEEETGGEEEHDHEDGGEDEEPLAKAPRRDDSPPTLQAQEEDDDSAEDEVGEDTGAQSDEERSD